MPIVLNGSTNVISGLAVGGLPDGIVDTDMLAADAVTGAKVADDAVGSEHIEQLDSNLQIDRDKYIGTVASGQSSINIGSSGGSQIGFHKINTNDDDIRFYTHVSGSSHGERMRILNNGRIGFGTTGTTSLGSHTGAANVCTFNYSGITITAYGVTTGICYDRLNFTNAQYYVLNSSSVGVYLSSGNTSWSAQSDERLKTDITELDGTKAYNHVKTARAASFKWNVTGYPTDNKIGFIAQDWESNYPEVINITDETVGSVNNPKAIQYTETVPVLMAALKQTISKLEAAETKISTLETKVAALEAG